MAKQAAAQQKISIAPPDIQTVVFGIRGTAPLVMHKFSEKARTQMREKQEAGPTGKKGKAKEAKDFAAMCEGAKHISKEGWCGIPASAFRSALISACRLVGFQMTRAKISLFVKADGFDADEGTGLVRITKGEPHYSEHCVRLETGVADIHARPMWDAGWEAKLTVQFDGGQFTVTDVANLMMRVGLQVGVLEGRPDSKNSAGMGWGTFELIDKPGKGK
jgi:hypothetical protein